MSITIETVTGKIPMENMGKTLIHEHFLFGYPGFEGDVTLSSFNRKEAIDAGIQVAEKVMRHGVKTIVDPTPNECGRNPEILKEIAEITGLQIICATGYYYEGEGAPPYFKFRQIFGTAEDDIYDMFITEIKEGIAKTGIRPGVIKLASSKNEITAYEKLFFKVAAEVHKETGMLILTHTQDGTMGPEQARWLIDMGVDPSKIIIGHMCGNTDEQYHIKTLQTGVKIGFDRFGLQKVIGAPMDEERINTLLKLLEKGYEEQIMLSHDSINYWMGRPPVMDEEVAYILNTWHPAHLFENIIPQLEQRGVPKQVIEKLFLL